MISSSLLAEGGLEALESLEKMYDFNESLYGWEDT